MTYIIEAQRGGNSLAESREDFWEDALDAVEAMHSVFPDATIVCGNMDKPHLKGDGLTREQRKQVEERQTAEVSS